MGVSYRFLALDSEAGSVLEWFRRLEPAPEEIRSPSGLLLHFSECGPLVVEGSTIDGTRSPVVQLLQPETRRSVLRTVGEVNFVSTPLRTTFPNLHMRSREFRSWLAQFSLVFSRAPSFEARWNYFLEGSVLNSDPDIYALPRAYEALCKAQYFVAAGDNDHVLDRVCKTLRLRGVSAA